MKEKRGEGMATPLMRQYQRIKREYPDTILLFRMGDFFETFEEDAVTAARVLGITLTKRSSGAAGEVPLAGFPHHALDTYLPKLVRAGHRVAVCEQMEDPRLAKGLVKREVVEIVTPGVVFSEKLLDHKHYHFLAAVAFGGGERGRAERAGGERAGGEHVGVAFVDASTGDFFAAELLPSQLADQLDTIAPGEILVAKKDVDRFRALFGRHQPPAPLTRLDDWLSSRDVGYEILVTHFRTPSLKGFGIESMDEGIVAAGIALHYLKETQKANLPHLNAIRRYAVEDYITLDAATRRNLEITVGMDSAGREGSLIAILDRTATSMGGRLFKYWLTHPLKSVPAIRSRLAAVTELTIAHDVRSVLGGLLSGLVDFERVMGRICTGRATPRDVAALSRSARSIPLLRNTLAAASSPALEALRDGIEPLDELAALIDEALADDPPAAVSDGGVIRHGFHPELDDLRDIATRGREWMSSYQEQLRQETGIASLKVEYNRAFGFYINVSKANFDKVPAGFQRRQTLVNAERYITPELKEYEDRVLHARENILQIETELFADLRMRASEHAAHVQSVARSIAALDCLLGLAEAALAYTYTCPAVNDGDEIRIVDGRHPVVERTLPPGDRFVANDAVLGTDRQIMIITGPNMSGKSTYLRQTGLIVLLAQIGSFVPAREAAIGVVDRIFTRVGASDNIAAGESTFLVEMQEAANILHNATPKSLVLLDEVGRGTSTFDGISIAWAMTEYLHDHPESRAKTLFATHYHELNEMADIFPRIHNYKVEVREYGDKVIFLRNVSKGTADHSYGIHVAQMAGIPDSVIRRAKEVLGSLEGQDLTVLAAPPGAQADAASGKPPRRTRELLQINLFEGSDVEIRERLRALDVTALSPMQAWQLLEELKKLAEK